MKSSLRISLIFLLTTLVGHAFSQDFDFEADVTKGCAPLTVTLTDLSGVAGADIKYSFFEGQPFGDQNTFTYTEAGVYTVVQLVQTNAAAVPIRKENYIEVIVPEPPTFEVNTCAGFGVRLNVTDTLYDFYEIDFGDASPVVTVGRSEVEVYNYADETDRTITVSGGFTDGGNDFCGTNSITFTPRPTLRPAEINAVESQGNGDITVGFTIFPESTYILEESVDGGAYNQISVLDAGSSTFILNNKNAFDQAHCYRIVTNEPCTGVQVVSNEVCVGELALTDAQGTNQLEWPEIPQSPDFEQFNIIIDGVNSEQITTPGTTAYNHQDVSCNVEYCYQLEIMYTNGAISRSGEQCLVASSNTTPPTAENLNATVEGENIVLSYEIPDNAQNIMTVNVQRAESGGAFTSLENNSITSNTITDRNVNVNENSYCYQIVVQDSCNNISEPSLQVCTVLLNAIPGEEGTELSWSPFQGFPFGFSYTIEVLDENGDVVRTIDNLPRATNSFTDNAATDPTAVYIYRISVVADHNANEFAYSNEVIVTGTLELKAPEAFTPNGDGLNDTFFVRGNLLETYKLQVFNRWGDLIFISELQEQGWDGTVNGDEAPAGTYSFLAEAIDINGNNANLKGLFILIR